MYSPREVIEELSRHQTSKRSEVDGESNANRPIPVYIMTYDEDANVATVKRRGDASPLKKEIPLDHHPKEIGALSPGVGDKVYLFPRGANGQGGPVLKYGHDNEKEAEVRKANNDLYHP
tara:strand:- start:385 stop:741 length:357 start_codon:yes stop_codon:yes gene_type:complete